MYNLFRLGGDFLHMLSILILIYKMHAQKSCAGVSLKTQVRLSGSLRLSGPLFYWQRCSDPVRGGLRGAVHRPAQLVHLPVQQRHEARLHLLLGKALPMGGGSQGQPPHALSQALSLSRSPATPLLPPSLSPTLHPSLRAAPASGSRCLPCSAISVDQS